MKKDVYELSKPQEAIWLTEQYFKNTNINDISCYADFSTKTDNVDFDKLKKAINNTIKNNDVFQTRLFLEDGNVKQYFCDFKEVDFPIYEISSLDELTKEEAKTQASSNLLESPLYDFKLFKYKGTNTGGVLANFHHLISDATSASLTPRQFTECYNSLTQNNTMPDLNPDHYSYKQYLLSEKEYVNSAKFQKDKAYWEKVYETIPEVATIYSSKSSNGSTNCKAKRLNFTIDKELTSKINVLCSNLKISVYNFFMAVFGMYISRVSSLNDFAIGTPILNRSNYREKNTFGMYISTIPFRMTLDSNMSFKDFVSNVAKDSMSMLRHQKYSYQYIIENLRKREPSLPNLYKVLFSYQISRASDENSSYTAGWLFNNCINNDLEIHIFDLNTENTINIAYDYNISLYDKEEINSIHPRIVNIINQLLENPDILVSDIDIVTKNEKTTLLKDFNDTFETYSKDKSIVNLFEDCAENNPNKLALVSNKISLTYKELNELSNKLAYKLIDNGIKSNSVVGILVNRSPEMIVGLLAILKCGATYLPLDPEYPKERVNYILDNSKAKVLLVNDTTINLTDDNYKKINISLNLIEELDYNTNNINTKIEPDSLMYLIYTSGTTGNPKGVMVTYNNVYNFVKAMKKNISFDSSKVMASVTTICFDIFGLEIWCSLTSSMTFVLANEKEQNITELLNALCLENNVDMIQTTPSRYLKLINDKNNLSFLSNITDILVGGEGIPSNLLDYFQNNLKANIFNMYGPTETTIWSTMKDLTKADSITIGKPILNTTCYILDNNLQVLPYNTPGTLYIGGDGVTKGYYGKEDLTNEKFVTSPFNENEIIYNTNDLAYWTKSGEIIHIGRNDFQVKLNGYRVELSEIEGTIESFYDIEKTAVQYDKNSKKLYAFYTANNNISLNDLKSFLLKKLPAYMIPYKFIKVDSFPYTPNGKLDRKALKITDDLNTKVSEFIKPSTNTEKKLYNIIKEMLELDSFSLSEDIFSLGMDSINTLNLSIKIESIFNKELSSQQILHCSSILDLAKLIDNSKEINNEKIEAKTIDFNKKYALSSAQKRVYYATKMDSEDNILYNMPGCIILDKKPDIKKLNECFEILIQRHSALRTYFEITDNRVYQRILPEVHFKVTQLTEKEKSTDEIFNNFIKTFDLSKAPLLRASLVTQKDQFLLLFDMHHIISDGLSLSIFTNELCKLYNGENLPKLDINYIDFAEWEQNRLKNASLKDSKNYWLGEFKNGIPVLDLPTNYQRPSVQSFEGSKIYKTIPSNISNKLQDLAKKLGVSNYMLLLSTYYILLFKYSGQEDIVVGTPVIGRDKEELLNTLGMFVNYLPLNNHLESSMSFMDFLDNIKNNCINSFNHQSYPFDDLVTNLNVTRDISRNPLFDTMFIYQNNGFAPAHFGEIKGTYYVPDTKISKLDLSLEVIPLENEDFKLNFEYCTKLFNENFIEGFSNHYINILNTILDNPEIAISDIEILSNEEVNHIINDFNDTLFEYPYYKTISQLFEEQVQKTPNNRALVANGKTLTFAELNKKANQIAYFLREQGIRPNKIVGIMMNRSLELITCMLGVLKSGGTYVPIDPTYPKDRIDYIIKDSGINILLTSSALNNTILGVKSVVTDFETSDIYNLPDDNLDVINLPNDLAYLIYTSGSTGKPKGVTIKHYNVNNLVTSMYDKIPLKGTFVSVNTFCFDMFVFEAFVSLLKGLCLVLANEQEQNLPKPLNKLCLDNKVNILETTPTRMSLLLSDPNSSDYLKNLDTIFLGGEAFPTTLFKQLKELTNATIYNMYGPTETTVWSSFKELSSAVNITIGKPIGNTTFYILDKDKKLLPPGIPGELYIGGEGVGNGYYHRINLTKKKFIVNPYNNLEIIYNTGDIARWTEDR